MVQCTTQHKVYINSHTHTHPRARKVSDFMKIQGVVTAMISQAALHGRCRFCYKVGQSRLWVTRVRYSISLRI